MPQSHVMDLSKRHSNDLPLGIFLLVLLSLHGIQGASIGLRIRRHHLHRPKHVISSRHELYYEPCGSKTTAAPLDALLTEVIAQEKDTLKNHFDSLTKEASYAKSYVDDLMRKYLEHRLRTSTQDLKSLQLDGLPSVPRPTFEELDKLGRQHAREHTHKSFQENYDRLVTMDMFLYVIKIEEDIHHGSLGYGSQLEGISQSHIFSILCRIRVAMSQHSMKYDSSHIDSLVHKEVRDVSNEAVRYISDYIILRELMQLLEFMELEFAFLSQNYETGR